jgi:hypothetical protein
VGHDPPLCTDGALPVEGLIEAEPKLKSSLWLSTSSLALVAALE